MNSLNRNFTIIILLIFAVLISACSKKQIKIKIIQTSDVHGAIFPYDIVKEKTRRGSLSQVHAFVKGERANENQEVLLLDNGDILQGDPSVYYYNFLKNDEQHLLSRVMNYMEYDVATIGNHDIEPGPKVYKKFWKELNFPWLAANLIETKKDTTYFKPYSIIEKEGVKIAVLGLITPGVPMWLTEDMYLGMEFNDMIESAKYWIEIIEKENPDLVIGLFHSGVDYNYGNQNVKTPKNENASRLVAEQVRGFDVILVGHDHQGWNEWVNNVSGDSVLLAGPNGSASNIVSIDVQFEVDESKSIITSINGSLIDMKDITPDVDFLNTFKKEEEELIEYFSQVICTFTEEMTSADALFGNSSYVDFIHTIQKRNMTGAHISFASPLTLNDTIYKGDFKISDLFKLYKYENSIYVIKMTAAEIDSYLEYSYGNWFNTMSSKDDHLLKFKYDADGELILSGRSGKPVMAERYYNFDSAYGIDYTVDISKKPGDRVEIHWEYTDFSGYTEVALNSYRANGGGGHLLHGAGINPDSLNNRLFCTSKYDMRYEIIRWMTNNKTITPKPNKNWNVIPDSLFQAGKKRDFELMFGIIKNKKAW